MGTQSPGRMASDTLETAGMTKFHRTSAVFLSCLALAGPAAPALMAQQVDVYVVYRGGGRGEKNDLVEALPSGLDVKSYNSNLLALADYSGMQKVIAKLETARVVVILGNAPSQYIEGRVGSAHLVIVNSVSRTVTTRGRTIYVIRSGTNVSSLGNLNTLNVQSEGDLANPGRVTAARLISVNESSVGMTESVALVVQRLLGN